MWQYLSKLLGIKPVHVQNERKFQEAGSSSQVMFMTLCAGQETIDFELFSFIYNVCAFFFENKISEPKIKY